MPVLLLVFLGATGITSIIEAVVTSPGAKPHIAEIIDVIINDERLRRASAATKAAMRDHPTDPARFTMPVEEIARRQLLLDMDPFDFERHVMSFFETAGLESVVTPKSNDLGADGIAVHQNGSIVVQCKRNAIDNKVGRPTIQQFKGVIEEHGAWRGYVVTTSSFTDEAVQSAKLSEKIILIDMDGLMQWHDAAPEF